MSLRLRQRNHPLKWRKTLLAIESPRKKPHNQSSKSPNLQQARLRINKILDHRLHPLNGGRTRAPFSLINLKEAEQNNKSLGPHQISCIYQWSRSKGIEETGLYWVSETGRGRFGYFWFRNFPIGGGLEVGGRGFWWLGEVAADLGGG